MSNVYYLNEFVEIRKIGSVGDNEYNSPTSSSESKCLGGDIDKISGISRLDARLLPPLIQSRLKESIPIVLYFVSWGRNAWNYTWISKYQRNTLMASYQEACHFIGQRTKQGTAFQLTVTPGWHLQFEQSAFLVCEINTAKPFLRLRDPSFTDTGIPQSTALRMLKPDSEIWDGIAPKHDSVIVQQTRRPAFDYITWEKVEKIRAARKIIQSRFPSDGDRSKSFYPASGADPGRYVRDASKETADQFVFSPSKKGGPDEFDCESFRILVGQCKEQPD